MQPFPTPDLFWQPGETRLHVYALPGRGGQPALLELVDRAAAVCARFGETNVPVPEEWLHMTVRMISLDAREVGPGQRADLAESLVSTLSGLAPFTLRVKGLTVTNAGVIVAFDDDGPQGLWRRMSAGVREAIGGSCGADALHFEPGRPHVSLTYCSRATDSAPIQDALRAVPHQREPFTIDALHLVDVLQDANAHTYTWRHLVRIPLG